MRTALESVVRLYIGEGERRNQEAHLRSNNQRGNREVYSIGTQIFFYKWQTKSAYAPVHLIFPQVASKSRISHNSHVQSDLCEIKFV